MKTETSTLTTIVAVLGTVLYAIAALYMFNSAGSAPDAAWNKLILVFNGVASVGFASIGVLLGHTVQQVNLAAARQENSEKVKAIQNAKDALANARQAGPSAAAVPNGDPSFVVKLDAHINNVELAYKILERSEQ